MTFSCSDSSYFHPSCSFSLTYKCITVHFILKELAVHPISILWVMLKEQDALSHCVIHPLCLLPSLPDPCQLSSPGFGAVDHLSPSHRLQHLFLAQFTLNIIPRELPFPMSISVSFLCQYAYNLNSVSHCQASPTITTCLKAH